MYNVKTFNKPTSNTFATLTQDGEKNFFAVIKQRYYNGVDAIDATYLDGREFKTEAGAMRWINKQLA